MYFWNVLIFVFYSRVVINSRGLGIFPGYEESGPQLLLLENRRKIEPKEIPSRLIPRLLVVFTGQLEILETTLILSIIILFVLIFSPGVGLFWHFLIDLLFPTLGNLMKNVKICQIPAPCPHSPPPCGIYIDRCITSQNCHQPEHCDWVDQSWYGLKMPVRAL